MSYEHYILVNDENIVQKVKQIIKLNELDTPSRNRTNNYQRAFLYNQLKSSNLGMSYREIGSMFGNRDHSTVMHGIKVHTDLTEIKDKTYAYCIKPMLNYFEGKHIDKNAELRRRILECTKLFEFKIVQNLINNGTF